VIGRTVAKELFRARPTAVRAEFARITVSRTRFVGVLASKGQGPMGDNDDIVVIPIKTYQQKIDRGLAKYIRGNLLISMTAVGRRRAHDGTDSRRCCAIGTSSTTPAEDDFRIRNPNRVRESAAGVDGADLDAARDRRGGVAVRRRQSAS